MIAIITCAGKGTRRHPDTNYTPKILLEYQGDPLIEHIARPIDMSERFEKLVFVLSLKHGQKVIDYVRRHPFETPVQFVWQPEPLGFGHAVLQARDEVFSFYKWNPPVLICTDDGIRTSAGSEKIEFNASPDKSGDAKNNIKKTLRLCDLALKKDGVELIRDITDNPTSTLGVRWVGNVQAHSMVVVDDYKTLGHAPRPNAPRSDVQVERLIEKPYWDEGGLAMTGIYFIRESRQLFRCLNKLVKSRRILGGEYQLTHALQMMIDAGTPFKAYYHDWIDCGQVPIHRNPRNGTRRQGDGKTRKRENVKPKEFTSSFNEPT